MSEVQEITVTKEKQLFWPYSENPRLQPEEIPNCRNLLDKLLMELKNHLTLSEDVKIAFFDSKSRLLNRRFFYLFTEKLQKEGIDFGLFLIDIDGLKAYNTFFGEPQGGDQAILAVANCLNNSTNSECPQGGAFLCRIDGDTFAILMDAGIFTDGTKESLLISIKEGLLLENIDLGKPTSKFKKLSDADKDFLRNYLLHPQLTIGTPVLVKPEDNIDEVLKSITDEVITLKESKRPEEIKNLIQRLG